MSSVISLIKDLPYRRFIALKEAIKMSVGTVDWPGHAPSIRVEMSADELESDLRGFHFEGLYLSYEYEGQVLDLRRPEGIREGDDGQNRQLELHIRARPHPERSGLEVIAHLEYSRYEHKKFHINEEFFRWLDEGELKEIVAGGTMHPTGGPVNVGWG